ncbi:MAG: hypothetical protein ACOYMX_02375 [Burkholderiales bacterium]
MNPQHLDEQMQLWSYVRKRRCNACGEVKAVEQFRLVEFRFKPARLSAVCIACELDSARERQRARRKTPEFREYLEKSRASRNALKTKYRRQAGVLPREEIAARAEQNRIEKQLEKQREKERLAELRASICDAHVRAWKGLGDAAYRKWKYWNDPSHAVYHRIKRSMHKHLGQSTKSIKWSAVLGYSMQELADHLERQFVDGMSWENKGEWHIDHIIPASSFDLTDESQLRACMALTNLRPLWSRENIKKGAKRVFLI